MARTLTTFRGSFASLAPAAGLLLSLADQSRPLTREVAAVTLDDYVAHLQQVAG